jgi:hypothetical protein
VGFASCCAKPVDVFVHTPGASSITWTRGSALPLRSGPCWMAEAKPHSLSDGGEKPYMQYAIQQRYGPRAAAPHPSRSPTCSNDRDRRVWY